MQSLPENALTETPDGIIKHEELPQQQNGLQVNVNLPPQTQSDYPNNPISADLSAQPDTGLTHFYEPRSVSDQKPSSRTIYPLNNEDDLPKPKQESRSSSNLPSSYYIYKNTKASNPPKQNVKVANSCCQMDEDKVKICLSLLLVFFTIANFAIIIALLVFHFGHKDVTLTSVGEALVYMGENLSADPILEVKVKDDTGSCDSGYRAMLLGTWPGTTRGCDCPVTGLKKGKCDKRGEFPVDALCTDIHSIGPIDMINWGGSYWCVKKANLGSQYTKSAECANGFRECSPGICVLSSLNCPVTKVEIQSSGTYKLRIGTNKYVMTQNVLGESPVVDLIITPNDIPCFSKDRYATGPTDPYKLLNENEKGCSKYGSDQYSFQIDKMKQDKLFDQNHFSSEVMNLPDYDDVYENTYSVLSHRQRINVAKNDFCLSIDIDLLKKSSYAAEKLNKFMSGTAITAMIIHGTLVLALAVLGFYICGMTQNDKAWKESWYFLCTGFGLIEYIDLIVMFAAVRHYRGMMVTTEEYLAKLASMGCFLDSQPQEAVSDYQVAVDIVAESLYKYSLVLFLITTVTIIPSFILICKQVHARK